MEVLMAFSYIKNNNTTTTGKGKKKNENKWRYDLDHPSKRGVQRSIEKYKRKVRP
jgi:hypothetical protein